MPAANASRVPIAIELRARTTVICAPLKRAGRYSVQCIWSSPDRDETRPAEPIIMARRATKALFCVAEAGCINSPRRFDALFAKPIGHQDFLVVIGLLELDEFLVEGVVEFLVLWTEAESAETARGFAIHNRVGKRMCLFQLWRIFNELGHCQLCCGIGIRTTGLNCGWSVSIALNHDNLRFIDTHSMQEIDLISTRNNCDFQRRIFLDVVIGMNVFWIAFWHQETFTVAGISDRELNRFAAVRQNILLGGDKLKAFGLQSGNKRAEWRNRPLDFFNSEFFEDCCGNVRADAFGCATRVHITIGHFVGSRSSHKARA